MRSQNPLIGMLRDLADALELEIQKNPRLDAKLEKVARKFLLGHQKVSSTLANEDVEHQLPDIHHEFSSRGALEFQIWLSREPLEVLKLIIRREDLDATRKTFRWKDPEKLAAYITEGLRARMSRGSAFMGSQLTVVPKQESFLIPTELAGSISSHNQSFFPEPSPNLNSSDDEEKIRDLEKINPDEAFEVRAWSLKLGVTELQLREAIKFAGKSLNGIKDFLKKS